MKFRELLFNQLALLTFILFSPFFLIPETIYADCIGICSNITDSPDYPSVLGKIKNDNTNAYTNYTFDNRASLKGIFAKSEQVGAENYEIDSDNIYIAASNGDGSSGTRGSANEWSFSFAPYLWLVGLNGTIGAKGQTADVDVSFGDMWDNLDFAFQFHAETMYRSKYGFFVDGTYLKLATKDVKGPLNIKTTMKVNMWEFVGVYRVYDQPSGFKNSKGQSKPSFYADLLGGGRLMHIDNKINFGGTGPIGASNQVSGDKGWFDFLVGARIKWQATNRLSFIGRTDIGGFGLGFSSDFAWNLLGLVGVDITDWMQFLIGYKVFYDDYSDGSGNNRFVFDAWMTGPITGLKFVF